MQSVAAAGDYLLYLYGFVRPDLAPPVFDGVEPGAPVFLVSAGDIACAASVVPAEPYLEGDAGDPAARAAWLTSRAMRHHEVLTSLHAAGAVLPLKFGATCRVESDVRAMLEDFGDTLAPLLDRLGGKDEWTLKISADVDAIDARFERESPALQQLRELEAGLPEGRAYFARKQRERTAATLVAQTLAALEDTVCDRLSALELPMVRAGRASDSRLKTITDIALLVDRADRPALEAALGELQADHAACGLAFALVGPWPPYSFVPPLTRNA
jgi:hypothetical protein